MRALVLFLLLAGCAAKQPAQIARAEPQYRSTPIVQRVPVVAIEPAPAERKAPTACAVDLPEEPPLVAGKLTGIATYDIGIIERSARELRIALQKARAALLKCKEAN